MKHTLRQSFLFLFLLCFLAGCDVLPSVSVNGTPVISSGTSTPQLNTWYQAAKGISFRYEEWKSASNDQDTVTIARFDMQDISLSVAYQPKQPMPLSQWMQQEHAMAVINGGYFDSDDNATALVVANGQIFGQSYSDFGGMLAVDRQGNITLRSLSQQPYSSADGQLQQATQSSPMLVLDGKATTFSADDASARRSVVAMDKQGHLLFIVSPNEAFTLDELAQLLVSSDLSIESALNLDGGSSTGLFVNSSGPNSKRVAIDSLNDIPLVIVVKSKTN
jgi:uncharacterized protein YigE (DUF2233 family)